MATATAPKLSAQECADLYAKARAAGYAAAQACVPTPMVVRQHLNPLDDNSPIVRQYEPVMGGVCGFAWVIVKPGNCTFANWLKKKGYGRKDSYYGGVCVNVSEFGQSMEKKMAYAGAFAKVIADAGFDKVYAMDRMD